MRIEKDYIEQLAVFELTGHITPEEKITLHTAIESDAEAKAVYDKIIAELTSESIVAKHKELRNEFPTTFAAFRKKERAIKAVKLASITTAVAAAILFTVVLIPGTNQNPVNTVDFANNKASHDIELKIGAAPSINLSKETGKIQSGNVVINNNNSRLSFLNTSNEIDIATLTVPKGKEYMLELPDGSHVQLNAATTLQFPLAFTGNNREITIAGEAYITVKKDATHPFFISLPHGKVQVLGTELNINTYNDLEDKVALVSGSIKVKTPHDSLIIKPGYEATATSSTDLLVEEFDPYDVLSWRKGEYPFTNATLRTVSSLIERYYGIDVEFEGESNNKIFTGVISRKTSINNFLMGLKLADFVKEYSFDKEGVLHLK